MDVVKVVGDITYHGTVFGRTRTYVFMDRAYFVHRGRRYNRPGRIRINKSRVLSVTLGGKGH